MGLLKHHVFLWEKSKHAPRWQWPHSISNIPNLHWSLYPFFSLTFYIYGCEEDLLNMVKSVFPLDTLKLARKYDPLRSTPNMIWGMDSKNLCQEKKFESEMWIYISNALAMRGTDCDVFFFNLYPRAHIVF